MKIVAFFLLIIVLLACSNEENFIPKPPTYLRIDLPKASYKPFADRCPYTFDIPDFYIVKEVESNNCHKDIDLGPLNGVIHFSYIEMTEPLAKYVNFANDKVDEHKIKATAINDEKILYPKKKVFGTFFELEGDVASPFQFYLTDSTTRFVSGVVYFNSKPNYDSLKPTLEYVKKDLRNLIETFEWK